MSPAVSTRDMLIQVLQQLGAISEQVKKVPELDTRLRAVEEFRGKLVGAVLVVSALFSGLGAWVGVLVVHR